MTDIVVAQPSAADAAVAARKLLDLPAVLARVPVCRAYWYERVAAGKAPSPVKVGKRSLWLAHEIDAWIDAMAARRGL
jgi:predicted DNA-binding transcriptional regulator AlpA